MLIIHVLSSILIKNIHLEALKRWHVSMDKCFVWVKDYPSNIFLLICTDTLLEKWAFPILFALKISFLPTIWMQWQPICANNASPCTDAANLKMYKYLITCNDKNFKICVSDKRQLLATAFDQIKNKVAVGSIDDASLQCFDADFDTFCEMDLHDLPDTARLKLSFNKDPALNAGVQMWVNLSWLGLCWICLRSLLSLIK